MPLSTLQCCPSATCLLPLHSRRRLARDVVRNAVHALHLVADLRGDGAQEGGGEVIPIGGHAVRGGDGAQRHHVAVRTLVALHAHSPDGQVHRERLPDLVIQPRRLDLLDEDLVHQPDGVQRVARSHIANDAHRQPGPREGVAREEHLGHLHQRAQPPHFILKEPTQRLDQLKAHALRQAAHVVVALDGVRMLHARPWRRRALDHVRVQRALNQERGRVPQLLVQALGEGVKDGDELRPDDLTLALRVFDALELAEELLRGVHQRDGQVQLVLEHGHHALGLLVAQ
mmetsp:Transcript_11767/g.36381  ORF Transcript_11767/g.36381 Transcript_11767/m.36381 type:complete len:286 (+) Transcript_11767:19-876(+)